MEVQRICQHCSKEFTAKTSVTQYCQDSCAKRAYKARIRAAKIESSNAETLRIKTRPLVELKGKEFLTVQEVATLLNCSVRSVYTNINNGKIKATNISQRLTRVRRSDLENLFD